MQQKENKRHEIRKRCLRSMFECSLDLVHDLESKNGSGDGGDDGVYTASEKTKIIQSGGWNIPVTKSSVSKREEFKNVSLGSKTVASGGAAGGAASGAFSSLSRDPLNLDTKDPAKIMEWYSEALAIYETAAMDTSLPLTAYNQLRASQLIDLLRKVDATLVAIPTASHSSHMLTTNKDKESAALVRNAIGISSNTVQRSGSGSGSTLGLGHHRSMSRDSSVDKALKTALSVGKAARLFKKKISSSSSSSFSPLLSSTTSSNTSSTTSFTTSSATSSATYSADDGPPPPPSLGLVNTRSNSGNTTTMAPLPVRNGFLVTHRQGLPPIQLEFQDGDSALRPPQLPMYRGRLSSQMEKERPVDKPIRNSSTKSKEEQRTKLAKQEKQHKETMDAKYGNWKHRCVIGPTKRKYLKYPEARYNPLAPMSGDLLVAALYAGSVDLSTTEEQMAREKQSMLQKQLDQQEQEELQRQRQRREGSNVQKGDGGGGGGGGGVSGVRPRRQSSVSLRMEEEDFTIQHLSRTRAYTEAKNVMTIAKEIHSVVDRYVHCPASLFFWLDCTTHFFFSLLSTLYSVYCCLFCGSHSRKSILRICVLGSDALLHRILCNYVCFRHEYEKRFRKLSIRLYVAPTARHNCDVATYLAREDAWYKRQIYAPFSTPLPIIPTTQEHSPSGGPADSRLRSRSTITANAVLQQHQLRQSSMTGKKDGCNDSNNSNDSNLPPWIDADTKAPNPMSMMQELMQDYIRSARHIVPICIFDCQCWEDASNGSGGGSNVGGSGGKEKERPPDMTIPFCMGAEIGIRARAALYRETETSGSIKQELGEHSLDATIGSRGFRKSWGSSSMDHNPNDCGAVDEISGRFTEVNPSGVPTGYKTLPGGSYYRIALRNIPLHADVVGSRGVNTHPSFSSMDLHILPQGPSTIKPTHPHTGGVSFPDMLARANKTGSSSTAKSMPGCTLKKETNLVMQTMLNEGVRYQVNQLDVSSNGAPFVVLLDGQCFGSFKRIKIVPCLSSKGEPQHFPISSFSPIV